LKEAAFKLILKVLMVFS